MGDWAATKKKESNGSANPAFSLSVFRHSAATHKVSVFAMMSIVLLAGRPNLIQRTSPFYPFPETEQGKDQGGSRGQEQPEQLWP